MSRPPVPQRIPPLRWRAPAYLWTPVGLLLAIGWPVALFYNDSDLQKVVLIVSAAVFAFALVTLGVSWGMGMAPRTRRTVILHVLAAGAIASLAAPFALTRLLATVADYEKVGADANFSFTMSATMAPLALILGLPLALVSGALFAWIALRRQKPNQLSDNIEAVDVSGLTDAHL